MSKIKLAVIYYSATGTNYQLAQWAAESAEKAGAEVKLLKVQELVPEDKIAANPAMKALAEKTKDIPIATPDDIVEADAIIFSSPTRYGNIASQMKQFIDTTGGIWGKGLTVNKVVSAMSSAQNPHGGQEATILALYTSMYHWGAIVAAPGYTDPVTFGAGGNPYGTSVSVDGDGKMIEEQDRIRDAVFHQAKRTVEVAGWVQAGKSKNTNSQN